MQGCTRSFRIRLVAGYLVVEMHVPDVTDTRADITAKGKLFVRIFQLVLLVFFKDFFVTLALRKTSSTILAKIRSHNT